MFPRRSLGGIGIVCTQGAQDRGMTTHRLERLGGSVELGDAEVEELLAVQLADSGESLVPAGREDGAVESGVRLDEMAALGVRFTILAPHQAHRMRRTGNTAWKDVSGEKIDPAHTRSKLTQALAEAPHRRGRHKNIPL